MAVQTPLKGSLNKQITLRNSVVCQLHRKMLEFYIQGRLSRFSTVAILSTKKCKKVNYRLNIVHSAINRIETKKQTCLRSASSRKMARITASGVGRQVVGGNFRVISNKLLTKTANLRISFISLTNFRVI